MCALVFVYDAGTVCLLIARDTNRQTANSFSEFNFHGTITERKKMRALDSFFANDPIDNIFFGKSLSGSGTCRG